MEKIHEQKEYLGVLYPYLVHASNLMVILETREA